MLNLTIKIDDFLQISFNLSSVFLFITILILFLFSKLIFFVCRLLIYIRPLVGFFKLNFKNYVNKLIFFLLTFRDEIMELFEYDFLIKFIILNQFIHTLVLTSILKKIMKDS